MSVIGAGIFQGRYLMATREDNLRTETANKAKFRAMQGERAKLDNMSVYNNVRHVMAQAELNALQTDYNQNNWDADEYFWGVVIGSIADFVSDHKNCPLEVRNWFELQGIWA
jgi:hypothetical protein